MSRWCSGFVRAHGEAPGSRKRIVHELLMVRAYKRCTMSVDVALMYVATPGVGRHDFTKS